MVTSSIPALPWFFFTFSQASSRFLRLYTLSISEWTFPFFFLCLIFDACRFCCSTVSSVLVLGLSRRELSNLPLPTPCFPALPLLNRVRGLPPPTYLLDTLALLLLGSNPRPFVLSSFMSTIPHSDSWHRIGKNFAFAYIPAYLPGFQVDVCVPCFSPFRL